MTFVLRMLGTLVWGALGVFHLWLLAQQVWSGRFDYAESVRWMLALGLAGAIIALRRRGGSLFRDRRATAIWVLVALLHGPALATRADLAMQALPQVPAVATQVLCAAAGLGLALACAVRRRLLRVRAFLAVTIGDWMPPTRTLDTHLGAGFLPRPPPVA